MFVTHCVCRQIPFTAVAHAARERRAAGLPVTLGALMDATSAGTGCGTCQPYLARVALTGATILPVMSAPQCQMWMHRIGSRKAAHSPPWPLTDDSDDIP